MYTRMSFVGGGEVLFTGNSTHSHDEEDDPQAPEVDSLAVARGASRQQDLWGQIGGRAA